MTISNISASPDAISLPGSTIIGFVTDAPSGASLTVVYSLSAANDLFFDTGEGLVKTVTRDITAVADAITEDLDIGIGMGGATQSWFFINTAVTDNTNLQFDNASVKVDIN